MSLETLRDKAEGGKIESLPIAPPDAYSARDIFIVLGARVRF